MASPSKHLSTALVASAVGGIAALALRFSQYPLETVNSFSRVGMLLTGAREYTYDLDGLPIHYYCAGRRGTPIVLIHGLGNSAEIWASLFRLLSREHLVYALDLPGFGQTPVATEGVMIRTHVVYLRRFLDTLGYPRITLLGNSLGGWIATQFAATYPECVEHLYLLNSAGLRREGMHSPYATDRESAQHAMDRIWGYHVPLPRFFLDAVVRTSQMPGYKGFIAGYDVEEELDAVLEKVRVSTTIIWGMRDGILPLSCAYDFHKGIHNAQLVLLKHVGHMPQVQAPTQIAHIVKKVSTKV